MACFTPRIDLNRLKDSAREFMTQFGKEYLKMYGMAMFERIKDDMERDEDKRRLKYRDWKSIERPDVFQGNCLMSCGEGPGAFGSWKKVFLVERNDYNIAVYPNRKAYMNKKRPQTVIHTAGYVLRNDPKSFYRKEMRAVAAGLGLTEVEIKEMTSFPDNCWAFSHPWRKNYLFRIKSDENNLQTTEDGCCSCCCGDNAYSELETECSRDDYLNVFERCTVYGNPRDVDSVSGKAFCLTVSKMKHEFSKYLSDFEDEGYESEILLDMLLENCFPPSRDDLLHDIKGPVCIRLVVWYKVRGTVQKTLEKLSGPLWTGIQNSAQALGEKVEPTVRKGVQPIIRVKNDIIENIKDKIIDRMGECLEACVTPYVDPILKTLDKPMTEGYRSLRSVLQEDIDMVSLPDDKRERGLILDSIPRSPKTKKILSGAADKLVKPLTDLKSSSGHIFDSMRPAQLKHQAEMSMMITMDAAIYSLETEMEEKGASNGLKSNILKAYDHDVILSRAGFVKDVVRSLLIAGFRKAIGPVADTVIKNVDNFIPKEMQDFISAAALFEEFVTMFVGQPIEQMVEAAYQTPSC